MFLQHQHLLPLKLVTFTLLVINIDRIIASHIPSSIEKVARQTDAPFLMRLQLCRSLVKYLWHNVWRQSLELWLQCRDGYLPADAILDYKN